MFFYKKYVQFHISINLFQYLLISIMQSSVNHSIYTSALSSWRKALQKLHFLPLYYGYSSVHQVACGTTGITISTSSLVQQLSQDTGMTGKSWPYVHKQKSIIKKKIKLKSLSTSIPCTHRCAEEWRKELNRGRKKKTTEKKKSLSCVGESSFKYLITYFCALLASFQ